MAHKSRTLVVRGDALRELRERRVGTLADLAAKLGLAGHSHLSRIENGRVTPSISTLRKIAAALEVELDAFTSRAA